MAVKNPYKRFDDMAPGKKANVFAVGKRTYNGATPSPQAGAGSVNPNGFSLRDNKAKLKKKLLLNQRRGI